MIVLGIESSCDETAAAVVKDGTHILSSVIASQIDVHHKYGGVVPELASRMHLEAITPVVDQALEQALIKKEEIDAVAATRGPGLIGALLVGFSFAKAFSFARNIPFTGVNHLEAHIYSLFLTDTPPEFPFIALVVSGGHTNIYYVTSHDHFELMGQTRDDAAGEAFDKVAKMLGLGYPGGPVIEQMAKSKNPDNIVFPRTLLDKDSFDFSFSGIKSAVARYIHDHDISTLEEKARIAASFQEAVIDVLCQKLIRAAKFKNCTRIGISGGVSANQTFVDRLRQTAATDRICVFAPAPSLCGDNAAMIAARGFTMIQQGDICNFDHDVFSRNRI
ncbi:MAG: tRNA (adenosine(37)-N6)-threonylcarbamoyltransferase complex transferase subunit TsaD [Proteobacteria bacterium]|nr:tRNA (adenosine(37)-N6)-threonylcarbamoyltransferase complex transferase subunit TsaD [Pseudomonadota bacterium]MBU1389537.1 tRNA (adenosine(37)-N6)-threonylcarbamoyltransferase complex transferase subunit TsaD [Pseudomonadota bacterium]MBU1544401.1 tRNA (adenosine(37)-N6)-threonylcarbamoyltransferase complex transferase subunit TsaD [Pseudomonadota bacterium]MBU2480675.1 tRNA (adenosine(37)-N6)-threonylcarbamoyltransferase complex transferase subunit TsaD [Pseudomonadota bacterium]